MFNYMDNNLYYEKYLKYKSKYFELKKITQTGGVNHPACAIIRTNQQFPTVVIKDKIGFVYYDAKLDYKTNKYYGKWCSNPNKGDWTLDANNIVFKKVITTREELLQLCHCSS